jgi:hypothetical protein
VARLDLPDQPVKTYVHIITFPTSNGTTVMTQPTLGGGTTTP